MSDNTKIVLDLELHEVSGIITALGELPTKTNAMFLIQKIKTQTQPQIPKEEKDGTA